jgi:hypothetical protein
VLLVDAIVAIRHGLSPDASGRPRSDAAASNGSTPGTTPGLSSPSSGPSVLPTSKPGKGELSPSARKALEKAKPGTYIPGVGTAPWGVHGNTIEVVYYWKGDRTTSSEYLGPTGQRGAVDEADAARRFVAYINKYANGGATLMGFPFNLHGRKLHLTIFDAGQYPETYEATALKITENPPFVAISSHGGLSDYICDYLFKKKIFNISTYDLGRYETHGGLYRGTNQYCLPAGMTWENQIALSVPYLANQSKTTKYRATKKRVYGILYAEYPGLKESVDRLEAKLKAAGLNVPVVYSLPTSLTDAARGPATKAVGAMASEGVNTIIAPDSGAPITFTHAAQARGYSPDYYVWPCSGEDAAGQVRLYDPAQWANAQGLSCYDEKWGLDLTLDNNARDSQWYHQYQEMAGRKEPPSLSPLVYQALLPMLVGITNAGRDVTVERFRAGMMAFKYPKGLRRYDAIKGPTTDPSHFWVALGDLDGGQIGDCAKVTWSSTKRTPGNTTAGSYVYSDTRYKPGYRF